MLFHHVGNFFFTNTRLVERAVCAGCTLLPLYSHVPLCRFSLQKCKMGDVVAVRTYVKEAWVRGCLRDLKTQGSVQWVRSDREFSSFSSFLCNTNTTLLFFQRYWIDYIDHYRALNKNWILFAWLSTYCCIFLQEVICPSLHNEAVNMKFGVLWNVLCVCIASNDSNNLYSLQPTQTLFIALFSLPKLVH